MVNFLKQKEDADVPLIKKEENGMNNNYDSGEDDEDETFLKNDITLWMSDGVVLVVEHFQYYAVLLALSEHWGWPISWVKITCFTLIFNLDIWEFRKVESGLFDHSRASFIDSSKMGFNYVSYLAAWAVFLFILGGIFGFIYIRWMRKRPLHLILYIARWKRLMFMVLQFLAIPFGVVAARIFHCRNNYQVGDVAMANEAKIVLMDVQNEIECGSTAQIILMVLVMLIFALMFLFYPFILSRWIGEQVFSNDPQRHEGYVQLKEAEYEQGLDMLWDVGQYHLFSSFKRTWAYYNPLKFLFKLMFIFAFAFSLRAETVRSLFWSSAAITVLFCLATVALMIKRPYRVTCFNFIIIVSHLALAANSLIGNFMVRPPWEDRDKFQIVGFLLPPTITHILIAINVTWLIFLLLWCLYLLLVHKGLVRGEGLWPRLSYEDSNTIGYDTIRYLKAALKARCILESSLASIPLFAPIHELSHQVQVINAYCREAEMLKDPTHDTLIDLLDELIEAHNSLAPVSVFGLSGKNSIKETSDEFIKLMPSFKKRLRQREYDFILMTPLKRRLLLKMYIMSVFIGNIKKQKRPEDDVKTKLEEALALFDTRSLDDLEFVPSTSNSTGRNGSGQQSSNDSQYAIDRDSSLSSYLDTVDRFIGKNLKPEKNGSAMSLTKKISLQALPELTYGKQTNSYRRPGTSPVYPISDITDEIDEVAYRPQTAPTSGSREHKKGLSLSSIPGQVDEKTNDFKVKSGTTTFV